MAAQAAKRINKVGFLVAMQEEAAPFIGALKLQKRAPHASATACVGTQSVVARPRAALSRSLESVVTGPV